MWFNAIWVLFIVIAVFIGFTGYSFAKDSNKTNGSALDELTKLEYNNKLEQLPPDPDLWNEPVGAMCYKVAQPPAREEYICPVCCEMTLYPSFSILSDYKIRYYRNLVKKITKIDVKIDESQLCEKCNPNAENRQLCLVVKLNENSIPRKTCYFREEDIQLLYEYSEGIKEHDAGFAKVPLMKYKLRLEELTGEKINDNGK